MQEQPKLISIRFSRTKLRDRNRELSVLLDISTCLSTSTTLEDVLDGALKKTLEYFDFETGRIYLIDDTGQSLKLAAHIGMDTKGLERVSIDEGFTGKAARTRSFMAQHVSDLEDKSRAALLSSRGLKVVICVPLIGMDQVIGVMNLATPKEVELRQSEIDLLIVVGTQIAIAASHARLFERLEQKIKEIQEKKDTIEFFAYSASHDLKSPAVGVYGLTQLLHRHYCAALDEKGRNYCTQIMKASGEIVALVDKINAYIKMKETALTMEKLQVKEILEHIRSEFSIKLNERNIRWVEPDSIPEVVADRLSLTRVFRNYIDNALKYGGAGLSEIKIGYNGDDPKLHIFSVSDNGIGINPGDAERLFRPFQRQSTSKGIEGTGLGLAIVKDIAEKHGGAVWVESEVGEGTTFFISIPKSY